tara:strand:+ start:3980 stop:4162 length:183 start_codon:yes stop_codon:yes gene_type:complete
VVGDLLHVLHRLQVEHEAVAAAAAVAAVAPEVGAPEAGAYEVGAARVLGSSGLAMGSRDL